MGRDTGPREKLSRREGTDLFLKGERALKGKSALVRRGDNPPGQHGARRRNISEYGLRLREKQKVRRIYQVREKQFRKYYRNALQMGGVTGDNLLSLLERRLDNVIYRMSFASTRPEARQMVNHGHIEVNGKKVDISSYRVSKNDEISIKEKSREVKRISASLELLERSGVSSWLEVDSENLRGKVLRLPVRDDITMPVEEQLIVEFYSRV